MSKIDDGGPAFPRTGFYPETVSVHNEDLPAVLDTRTEPQRGMSVRDLFAAHALAGILAAHAEEGMSFPESDRAAKLAYGYADALLKQRTKPAV